MTGWEPIRQARTHELVIERIEQRILAGELQAGEQLPPERRLAAALGVSRSAIREALRVLEAFGVLVAQTGRGPDAGATIVPSPDGAVSSILRMHLSLGSYSVSNTLETRIMLERTNVSEAARNAATTDLDPARKLLDTMDEPEQSIADYNDLDSQFHIELARCCGNELTRTLTSAVRESVRPLLLPAMESIENWPSVKTSLQQEHREILQLISQGESEKAADTVESHIRGFHGTLTAQA